MTEDTEIDVEQLRTELDHIKDAMGIQERYGAATSMWLLFGFAVPVASALSQYVFTERLPGWYHALIWAGVLGGAYAVWFAVADDADELSFRADGKPNLFVQFGLVYFSIFPIQAITAAFLPELGYVDEALLVQSLIVVLVGLAYGLLGSSLAAYYVRWRDRAVFYVGTAWMMALGVAIPYVDALQTWPHASFGGLYFVYAVAAYVVLTRT
jgi:hypothetical protein